MNLIAEQIRRGPEVKRDRPSPNLFSLTPAYSFDDLTMYLEVEGIESAWLPIEDVLSGRTIEFRVIIGRHGFLRALEGRVRDGEPWPDRWDVAEVDPAAARQVLFLPPEAEHRATVDAAKAQLQEWLTMALEPDVKLYPPPSEATLVSRERSLGGSLPPTFREFLSLTDGLEFRGLRLLGHRDIYPVDSPRLSALVVAWDADDSDDFLVVVAPGGSDDRVFRLDVHLPEPELLAVADTFRDYLRSELAATKRPRRSSTADLLGLVMSHCEELAPRLEQLGLHLSVDTRTTNGSTEVAIYFYRSEELVDVLEFWVVRDAEPAITRQELSAYLDDAFRTVVESFMDQGDGIGN